MMNPILSPEEQLDTLYNLLNKGKTEEALKIFSTNSSYNQAAVFRLMLENKQYKVLRTQEYIVVISNTTHGIQSFVVGLDENYRFFCHNLPPVATRYLLKYRTVSDYDIRKLMGFDLHRWEVEKPIENFRIRIQGDLVLHIEKVFSKDEDLPEFLESKILQNFRFDCRDTYTGRYNTIKEEAKQILEKIYQSEKIIKIMIGNHKIRFIGVIDNLIPNFQLGLLRDRLRALILRPHELVAHHDEHKTITFPLQPGIISISTLITGPITVRREQNERLMFDSIIRIKVLLLDINNFGSWRLVSNVPPEITLRRFVGLDAEFFILRKTVRIFQKNIMIETILWYLSHEPSEIDELYLKGSNLIIFTIRTLDKKTTKTINRILQNQNELKNTIVLLIVTDRNISPEDITSKLKYKKIVVKKANRIDGQTTIGAIFSILEKIVKEKLRE